MPRAGFPANVCRSSMATTTGRANHVLQRNVDVMYHYARLGAAGRLPPLSLEVNFKFQHTGGYGLWVERVPTKENVADLPMLTQDGVTGKP